MQRINEDKASLSQNWNAPRESALRIHVRGQAGAGGRPDLATCVLQDMVPAALAIPARPLTWQMRCLHNLAPPPISHAVPHQAVAEKLQRIIYGYHVRTDHERRSEM